MAMCIWKADDPNYHSDNEHVDSIDWNAVKAVAQVVGVAAWRVANDTRIVFPRLKSSHWRTMPGQTRMSSREKRPKRCEFGGGGERK